MEPQEEAYEPVEQAYDKLLELIFKRHGYPENKDERDIAQDIGWQDKVDTVRLALGKLVEDRIVSCGDSGYSLVPLNKQDILRYLRLREVLEIYFTRRLVRRRNDNPNAPLLVELEKAIHATEEAVSDLNRDRFWRACRKFHREIGRAAAYPLAGIFSERLWALAWRIFREKNKELVGQQQMEAISKEHKAIFVGIKEGHEAKVVGAIKKHYRAVRKRAGITLPWWSLSPDIREKLVFTLISALISSGIGLAISKNLLTAAGVFVSAVAIGLVYSKFY